MASEGETVFTGSVNLSNGRDEMARVGATVALQALEPDGHDWSRRKPAFAKVIPAIVENRSLLRIVALGAMPAIPWNAIAERPVEIVGDPLAQYSYPDLSAPTVIIAVAPDIAVADDEIEVIRNAYPNGTVHVVEPTPDELLELAGDCDVLHLICHGEYDHQLPLRSSLRFHGGVVTGYQIQRLEDAPGYVVAAACRAGVGDTSIGATSIGLNAAWLRAGARAVIAPSCRLPDNERTVTTMGAIHQGLATGLGPGESVFQARETGDEAIARSLVVTTKGVLVGEHDGD